MVADTQKEPVRSMSARAYEQEYRPVSQMAIVSLVLGILSVLAFASVSFWLIAFAALPITVLTSRRLDRIRNEYAGQLVTKIGMFLALVSAVGAPTRHYIERAILVREAKAFAADYLDLILANRHKQAYARRIEPWTRAGSDDSEAALDQQIVRSSDQYREFLGGPTVAQLAGKANEAQVTFLGVPLYAEENGARVVGIDYRIRLDSRQDDVLLRIVSQGAVAPAGEWTGRQWYVRHDMLEHVPRTGS